MSRNRKTTVILALFCFLALTASFASAQAKDPNEILAALKARSIGPANMSGRIGAVEGVASSPAVIYVGAAAGGVWKSVNGGLTWTPIFDDQPAASIGAIAVDRKNPNVVWVGTGEAAPRNSVSVGRGVFKSIDGGRTWQRLGLEKTEKIAEIVIHPDDSDTVLVGALGATWGDSVERGVFKTSDGGRTWRKVLYVNEKTGVSDMAVDPANPNHILAAMWEHRRQPWFFSSGGPGSGLYATYDGGETWARLGEKEGLPAGELGRIGIAFAANRPEVAYALVEAKKNGLYRSADGGRTWQLVNDSNDIHNRPFYYSRIMVNPVNENIVYMLQTQLRVSEDGGKTFRALTANNQAHSDFHAMWISPDGETLVVGEDGGVVISHDRGRTWRFVENLPLGQFYHVTYDMQTPYNVYGGLQDNGTWVGPAYSLKERALYDYLWTNVGGGDGFDAAADPEKPGCGYGMSQGGSLYYFDIATGRSVNIVPTESDVRHRFNWNAGFAVDHFKPATIYLGSQFVHRSPDKGRTWEIISPDLTTNDPEKQKQAESGGLTLDVTNAENYCTILSIAPSPLKEGLIWVGTDDGNVQLTRDGGRTWELVSKTLASGKKPLVPAGAAVPHIKPSRFNEAAAYVVFDDHRRSNFQPYVLCTADYGKTWKNLATAEVDGYCMAVEEDPVKKDLLFLGTEFGLFVSLNGGGSWFKWKNGLPTCPVYDLTVHPRENDLIIATHGRSLYVIDDISPLRELSDEVMKKKLHLFPAADAFQFQPGRMSSYMSPGDAVFAGENKRTGAAITYFLTPVEKKPEAEPEPTPEQSQMMAMMAQRGIDPSRMRQMGMLARGSSRVQISILDAQGAVVASVPGTEEKGINRVYWDFRETAGEGQAAQAAQAAMGFFGGRGGGLMALPGRYTVKVKYEGEEASQSFEVKTDPRFTIDPAVLKANHDMAREAQRLTRTVQTAAQRLQQTQQALQTVGQHARQQRNPKMMDIMKQMSEVEKKLKALQETLNPTPPKQGIADRSAGLQSQVMSAVSGIAGAGIEPVSQAARVKYDKVRARLESFLAGFNEFYEKDVAALSKTLQEAGFSLLPAVQPLKLN
jgi:photosystem II stability/assembly factor-like uncharacterized protein